MTSLDEAVAVVEDRARQDALDIELIEKIGEAHDRAFWEFLRTLMPWYPTEMPTEELIV